MSNFNLDFILKYKKITTQPLNYVVTRFMRASDPIRTGDLLITSELLYLLSHTSIFFILGVRLAHYE